MIRHLHHQYYPYRPALSRNITACYLIPVIVTRIQYDTIPRVPEPDAPFILPVPLKFLKMKRTVLENIQKGIRTQYDILRSHQFGLHLFRISPALSVFRTELSLYSDTFADYLHAPEATRKSITHQVTIFCIISFAMPIGIHFSTTFSSVVSPHFH